MKSTNPDPRGGPPAASTFPRLASVFLTLALLLPLGGGLQAAIAYRAAASADNGTGAMSLTINKPTGVVDGDVMLAGIARVGASSSITPPTGWTHVRNLNDGFNLEIYRKTAGASEPSSYTWTLSATQRVAGGIVALSGVDTANPIQAENGAVEGTTAKTAHATPSITTTGTSTWLVSIFADRRESGAFSTWTAPGGTTERVDDHSTHATTTNSSVAIFTVGPVSAGSVSHTATASGSSQYAAMEIIALNAASGGGGSAPAAPSALAATAISGTQINLSWTDNASDETGFKLERKTGVGGTYAQIATPGAVGGTGGTGTYNDTTGLSPSTTYYYRIRATNANGDSAYSNEASAATLSGFACLDGGGGTLSTAFQGLGTTTTAAWLSGGSNTRYDFTGTHLDNTFNSGTNEYTPSFNVRFQNLHDGGCAFGGIITNGYAQSLGRYGSGVRNYPANDGGQFFIRDAEVRNFTIDGWRMHHNWDPIRFGWLSGIGSGTYNVTIKQCWITDTYDDVIENDNHRDGVVVDDCLIERCFVFVSDRNSGTTNYGSRTLTVNNCLVSLDEMNPNDVDSVGHFFKVNGNSIKFDIYNSVFYVPRAGDLNYGGDPFGDIMSNGKLRNSSGNKIVWAGGGAYPFTVPTGFTVVTDVANEWTAKVAAWKTNHPHVPRITGVD